MAEWAKQQSLIPMMRVQIGRSRSLHHSNREGSAHLVQGPVSKLQRVADVDGGHHFTSTYHICIFDLNGVRSQVGGSSPPLIAEGDVLRAAGTFENGIFDISVYRNLTTGWRPTRETRRIIDPLGILVVMVSIISSFGLYAWLGTAAFLMPVAAVVIALYMARQTGGSDLMWDRVMKDDSPETPK